MRHEIARVIAGMMLMLSSSVLAQDMGWVGSWAASPMAGSTKVDKSVTLGTGEMTVRETVHLSLGGKMVRVTLSNEFGTEPLTVSDAHVGLMASAGTIRSGSDHALSFGRSRTVTIEAGKYVTSDSLDMKVPAFADFVISVCVPEQRIGKITEHELSSSTTYIGAGDQAAEVSVVSTTTALHWYLLKDVQVSAEKNAGAVVTFGDSITDGAKSTPDRNQRWPDYLAKRLAGNKKTKMLSVLDEGIGGNRILHAVVGPSALDRLDRDVLNAPGVKYVLWLEGINDIGRSDIAKVEADRVTADQIIAAMKEGVQRMRARGIKVIGCTLTPFVGAKYSKPEGEAMREAINAFIRTPGSFDGVVDFEKVTQDPQAPERLLKIYDSGDHLHPTDSGYEAMGDAVSLKLFQ